MNASTKYCHDVDWKITHQEKSQYICPIQSVSAWHFSYIELNVAHMKDKRITISVTPVLLNLVLIPSDVCRWLNPIMSHLVVAAGQCLQLISCGGIHHSGNIWSTAVVTLNKCKWDLSFLIYLPNINEIEDSGFRASIRGMPVSSVINVKCASVDEGSKLFMGHLDFECYCNL